MLGLVDQQPSVSGATIEATHYRIADSLEGASGYDPNNILVSAEDTADGVSISINGDSAIHPGQGVSWSMPLRGIGGGEIGPVGTAIGRSALLGHAVAIERTAWSTLATPSNGLYWVGVASGPLDGSTVRGVAYMIENTTAGTQRAGYVALNGGTWNTPVWSSGSDAASKGIVGCFGGTPSGNANNLTYAAAGAFPYEAPGPSVIYRALSTGGFTVLPGETPHFFFGAGHSVAGQADTTVFDPLTVCLGVVDYENLIF